MPSPCPPQTLAFSFREVAAAKSGWLQSRTVSRAQDSGVAGTLNHYLFIDRNYLWDEAIEKKVMALTPEQVNAAMKKHISLEKMNIIKAGDFAKGKGEG